jgi:hypothetical protein
MPTSLTEFSVPKPKGQGNNSVLMRPPDLGGLTLRRVWRTRSM